MSLIRVKGKSPFQGLEPLGEAVMCYLLEEVPSISCHGEPGAETPDPLAVHFPHLLVHNPNARAWRNRSMFTDLTWSLHELSGLGLK